VPSSPLRRDPRLLRPATAVAGVLGVLAFSATSAEARPLTKPTWVTPVTVTEYYPAPERWAVSRLVAAPGLAGRHRADWLYSANGMAMEGDGIGLDGHWYHIETTGTGWVDAMGRVTAPGADGWTGGSPAWLLGTYWTSATGARTFPLGGGVWTQGRGVGFHAPPGVSFGRGQSRPLTYDRTLAVDPRLIPLGSRVFLPAYRFTRFRGWFIAADTGGAIGGRHVDVFRKAPASPADARSLTGQRMYVIPPRR
jgi:3D (Asp-Asp-Asp) domain-containing protein